MNNKYLKSVSPLIATILLIVISVILVVAVLTWGKDFVGDSLEETNIFYQESNLTGLVTTQNIFGNFVVFTNHHKSQDANIIGYKIVPSTDYFLKDYFDEKIYYFDESVLLTTNSTQTIFIDCFPERSFFIHLLTNDNTYIQVSVINNNYSIHGNLECGLVGYWKFDEGKGNVVNDYSHKKNNFIISNPATFWFSERGGDFIDNTLSRAAVDFDLDHDFTISTWIKFREGFFDKSSVSIISHRFRFFYRGDWAINDLYFTFNHNYPDSTGRSAWWHYAATRIGVTEYNEWINFIGVIDGNNITIYKNNAPFQKVTYNLYCKSTGSPCYYDDLSLTNTATTLIMGHNNFDGFIRDTRIYNRALTEKEIENIYNLEK